MNIIKQACGDYATNCYILNYYNKDFIIDPGQGALEFVKKHAKNPKAILNTHGHFDHIWDNDLVKKEFNIPIYIHENDEFMLKDPFNMGYPYSNADILIKDENDIDINGVKFRFIFLPGHTPGCCMIEVIGEDLAFSGDFLFKNSIGRYDFLYSNANLMKQSLEKIMLYKKDLRLLPGHGLETSLSTEQKNIPYWLNHF